MPRFCAPLWSVRAVAWPRWRRASHRPARRDHDGSARSGPLRVAGAGARGDSNSGGAWPYQRISVNLSPAYLRKFGSAFDLPIALAVLAADGQLPTAGLLGVLVVGELGLDGSVRPVRGVLPMVVAWCQWCAARHRPGRQRH